MFYLLLLTLLPTQETALTQQTLPHLNKLGYAQTKDEKILFSYTRGVNGLVSMVDLAKATIQSIDKAKANYYFPFPMVHGDQFVLLDTLLKKMIFLGDDGSVGKTVHLKDITPQLTALRIVAASVYSDTAWLLTLEDKNRKMFLISLFAPATGVLTPWFEKDADTKRKWLWIQGELVRISTYTGEVATVDPATGKRLELLRGARDPLIPKKKPSWMMKLVPYTRLAQVIFGPQPSLLLHDYKDDDPEQMIPSALTFLDGDVIETPLSVLADHGGKRLLFDWSANELVWEATEK